MPDREKVIKGLEICQNVTSDGCKKCPYYDAEFCSDILDMDALALLKEQEAVEAITDSEGEGDFGSWWYACGACRREIDYKDAYCRHCGRKMRWRDG